MKDEEKGRRGRGVENMGEWDSQERGRTELRIRKEIS